MTKKYKDIGYIEYTLNQNVITITSVFVNENFRGKGIANKLMEDFCNEFKKYKIVATCSYADSWLKKRDKDVKDS